MRTQEKMDVMQAYLDGEIIESSRLVEDEWSPWGTHYGEPAWNWTHWRFRVKPKPREFWIVVQERSEVGEKLHAFHSFSCASAYQSCDPANRQLFHVIQKAGVNPQ